MNGRHAFTLIEVLVALLMVALGLVSVISMTLWGTREGTKAIAMATSYGSARTALYDPSTIDSSASLGSPTVSGYLNGYYVVRTIESSSIMPASAGTIDRVRVDVYWGNDGESLAGLTSFVRR